MMTGGTSPKKKSPHEIRELFESSSPIARVGFFGAKGPEEDAVYDFMVTGGGGMLSMTVDRGGHLARVLTASERLIYLFDLTPRQMPARADVRVYLDGNMSFDAILKTVCRMSGELWGSVFSHRGQAVRGLFSQHALQEIVPLHDTGDDISLLTLHDEYTCELWPEMGHKR
jgi:hypothetical protein